MLFDSDTVIATYGTDDTFVSLEVQGEVSVEYEGTLYRHASEMPEELLDILSEEAWDDDRAVVYYNNWFAFVFCKCGEWVCDDIICMGVPEDEEGLLRDMQEMYGQFERMLQA